jgi:NitT/TauT family transport system substrate-binding protein
VGKKSLGILAVILLALAASLPAGGGAVAPPGSDPVRVGHMPIFAFAPFFVALDKGYFEEEGIAVELVRFRTGSEMIAPLAAGHLEVGGGEAGPALLNAVAQGFDVRAVAALASQPPGYGAVPLLVRRDLYESGAVNSPADLAGRKVAVNTYRGNAEYLLAAALEGTGVALEDVDMISLPFPEMPAAFANGAIDGAILPHPLAARALGSGSAAVLVEGDKIADSPQNGVVYFGRRLLEEDGGERGTRFLRAYLKAVRDLQGEGWRDAENAAILAARTKVPLKAILKGKPYYFEPDGAINEKSLGKILGYHVSRGYTELKEPFPPDRVIDRSFLDRALDGLGKYRPAGDGS